MIRRYGYFVHSVFCFVKKKNNKKHEKCQTLSGWFCFYNSLCGSIQEEDWFLVSNSQILLLPLSIQVKSRLDPKKSVSFPLSINPERNTFTPKKNLIVISLFKEKYISYFNERNIFRVIISCDFKFRVHIKLNNKSDFPLSPPPPLNPKLVRKGNKGLE